MEGRFGSKNGAYRTKKVDNGKLNLNNHSNTLLLKNSDNMYTNSAIVEEGVNTKNGSNLEGQIIDQKEKL